MAKKMKTGATILATILLTISLIVFGVLANTGSAHASEEDCLLLVLHGADAETSAAGIMIRLLDSEGQIHSYLSDDNGLVHVPCGLLGDSLVLEDSSGSGYCVVLNERQPAGLKSSLLMEASGYGFASSPVASESGHGTILRIGITQSAAQTDN